MDPNVTSPQSEPDQDNSSLQNPSTNPAEAGTTDETRDEDHETSSIEALNWSEVEEEELAAAQQAEALAAAAAASGQDENVPPPTIEAIVPKKEIEEETTEKTNGSSTTGSSALLVNDEGNVLSTSLLQSINSTVSDEDPQARKLSVIENWASEVTNAVERGEMEMAPDFPDEDGVTGDDENEGDDDDDEDVNKGEGVRKRKGKKLTPDMVSSVLSSGESTVDPLSNAPVLDDGPIWNKGPRTYTFQENRRINQKLTFCVLIAVVLAIGLGLGNLVAHQECEAEFKASQKSPTVKPVERSPVPTTIPTTTPSPIIPDRSTDSSMMGSKLPMKNSYPYPSIETIDMDNDDDESFADGGHTETLEYPPPSPPPKASKRDEPIIDPKYKIHAETVSNVVHTLDQLSRKIDQFENTTRKLQGVLMIPDEEEKPQESSTESSSLYDEQVHRDNEQVPEEEEDFIIDEDATIPRLIDVEDLIEAIEQTPDYVKTKREQIELNNWDEDKPLSQLFDLEKLLPAEISREWKKMMKSFEKYREFERRFIKNERKRLQDEGKYDRFKWRVPEQYTDEEKKALNNKFKSTWVEYIKLNNKNSPNPLDEIFGEEEEIEERTYGDAFDYPYLESETFDPERYSKHLLELDEWEMENEHLQSDEEKNDIPDLTIEEVFPDTSAKPESIKSLDDDLIVLQEPTDQTPKEPPMESEPLITPQMETLESKDNGKSTDESDKHAPSNQDVAPSREGILIESKVNNVSNESVRQNRVKRDTTSKSKKSGHKSTNTVGSSVVDENKKSASPNKINKGGKRSEQKQKEPKSKQSGKQKASKMGVEGSTESGPNVKTKMSSKGKKLKNLESNKVFENVKGKSFEKRRVAPSSSSSGGTNTRRQEDSPRDAVRRTQSSGQNSKKVQRESTNSGRTSERQRNAKQKQTFANNANNQQQGRANNRNNGPRHYDGSDKERQQPQQQRPQQGNREKRGGGSGTHENGMRTPSQLKYDNQDLSSKETQNRQQKQEFNTNRYNGKSNNGNRKSKNWQNEKPERERPRERTTNWGTHHNNAVDGCGGGNSSLVRHP